MTIDNKVISIEKKVSNIEKGIWTIGPSFYEVISSEEIPSPDTGNFVGIQRINSRGGWERQFRIMIPIHYRMSLDNSEEDGRPRLFVLNNFDHSTSYHYSLDAFNPRVPAAMEFFKEDIRQNVIAQAMWWDNKYCNADYDLKQAYGFADFTIDQKVAMIKRGVFPISGEEYRPINVEPMHNHSRKGAYGIIIQRMKKGKENGDAVMMVVSSPNFTFGFDHGANGTSLSVKGKDGKPYNGSFDKILIDMPPELEGLDREAFRALKVYAQWTDTLKTGRGHDLHEAFYK